MIDTTAIDNIFKKVCNEYLSAQTGLRLKNKQTISLSDMCLQKDTCFDNSILNVISGSKSFSVKKSTLLDNDFFDTYKTFEKDYLALKMIADDKLHDLYKALRLNRISIDASIALNNVNYRNAICAETFDCDANIVCNHFNTLYDIQRKTLFPIFEKCALAHIKDMRNVDVKDAFGVIAKVAKFSPKIIPLFGNSWHIQLFSKKQTIEVDSFAFFDYLTNPFFIEYKAALNKSDILMQGYLKKYEFILVEKKVIESVYQKDVLLADIDFETEIRELIYNKYPALWN